MNFSKELALLGGLMIAAGAMPAQAEEANFYVGMGASFVYATGCELAGCSDEFQGNTWGLRGTLGYQARPWLAVEVGGHYYGEVTDDDAGTDDQFLGYGGSLSLVAQSDPEKQMNVFLRGGAIYGEIDENNGDDIDDDIAMLIGAGTNYRLDNGATVRGEVEYISDFGNPVPAGELDYLVFTLSYVFGR